MTGGQKEKSLPAAINDADREFYKSDSFFTVDPVLHALDTFQQHLAEHWPHISLETLYPNLPGGSLTLLGHGDAPLPGANAGAGKANKMSVGHATKKFKLFHQRVSNHLQKGAPAETTSFKR